MNAFAAQARGEGELMPLEPCRKVDMNASRSAATSTADFTDTRLGRESRTISAMVRIYCRDHHHPDAGLCPQCRQFLDYANLRLERCRFGQDKPTCANCPVHCYQRERREQARVVMRYAGPRMLWEHPILSARHWWDGRRTVKPVR